MPNPRSGRVVALIRPRGENQETGICRLVDGCHLGSGGTLQINRQCVENQCGANDRRYSCCSEDTMIDQSKFAQIRDEIIIEKGSLTFFALFLREGVEDRWDLLASAPWLDRDEPGGLRYITKKLAGRLSEREMLELSRIIIVSQQDPAPRRFLRHI